MTTQKKKPFHYAKRKVYKGISEKGKDLLFGQARMFLDMKHLKDQKGKKLNEYNSLLLFYQTGETRLKYRAEADGPYKIVKKQGKKFVSHRVSIKK